jgi:hypothetical protein
VTNLHGAGGDFLHVNLAWDSPSGGTTPERYAIWRQHVVQGERADQLVGITTDHSFRTAVPAARVANAYIWNVRPLDAGGSNGPSTRVKAGPRADTVLPSAVRVGLARRALHSLVVRWTASVDRQSGIESYQVQRRVIGHGGFINIDFTSAFPRSTRIEALPRGARVQVRVRAFDRAGNGSRWSPIVTYSTLA